ncbi:hypothetical protein [Actinoplanes sp. G11-F43]|uniref:hypothetical protein n=1 Tax=Actinoplanes sp. G11-F43 TaxID=3424130 RepID=UPI003D346D85
MTQMVLPYAYRSTRRTEPLPAPQSRWRLFGAEFTTAVVVNLGPAGDPVRQVDRGVMMTAAASSAVSVGPQTRLVAVRPSITSWSYSSLIRG